jgi:hypothetical protein
MWEEGLLQTSCLWDGIRQFPHEVAYVNLRAKGVAYVNSTCLEFSPVYYKFMFQFYLEHFFAWLLITQ